MEEMPAETVDRLLGRAEAVRAVLRFTGQWTNLPENSEFNRGIAHAAETLSRWAHERFGIAPERGKCPCYHCSGGRRPHGAD